MSSKARIKEVFKSIQGEGPFIGYKQVFIRFCGCNLNCGYCDTDFNPEGSKEYSPEELIEEITPLKDCHSAALTGGEPLIHHEFLKEFLPKLEIPAYLETNATLYKNLEPLIDYIDIISADIKLPSACRSRELWDEHRSFFKIASAKNLFAKIVFDKNITDEEIVNCTNLGKEFNIELILQPKTEKGSKFSAINNEFLESTLNKFLKQYPKVRLIPQVHKFLDIK